MIVHLTLHVGKSSDSSSSSESSNSAEYRQSSDELPDFISYPSDRYDTDYKTVIVAYEKRITDLNSQMKEEIEGRTFMSSQLNRIHSYGRYNSLGN
jgi:hypothetical protein